jgi:hypothetical protein
MARRYGAKVKTERKWKKITRMNLTDLNTFKNHLEDNNEFTSKVYEHVITRINNL